MSADIVASIDIKHPVECVRKIHWAHSTTNLALHVGIDEAAAEDAAVAAEGTARQ